MSRLLPKAPLQINQNTRRLFWRTQYFWPSTILHTFAILSRFGQLTDQFLKSPRALQSPDENESRKARGITNVHVYRQPFTNNPANHGTIVFSDQELAHEFVQKAGEKEKIHLPTYQSATTQPKYTDPTRVQYAGLKDIAPLIGLKLSNNENLVYNTEATLDPSEREDREAHKKAAEFMSDEARADPLPFVLVEMGRKEIAPPSRKYSDVRFPQAVEAFKLWKGFAQVNQAETRDRSVVSDTHIAEDPQPTTKKSSISHTMSSAVQTSAESAESSTSTTRTETPNVEADDKAGDLDSNTAEADDKTSDLEKTKADVRAKTNARIDSTRWST